MPKTVNGITIQDEWLCPMTFNAIIIQVERLYADNIQSIPGQLFNSQNTKGFLNLSEGGGGVKGPALIICNVNPALQLRSLVKKEKPRLTSHLLL